MNEQISGQEQIKQKVELKTLSVHDAENYFKLIDDNREYFGNFDNLDPNKYQNVKEVVEVLNSSDKIRHGIYRGGDLIGTINLQGIARQKDKTAEIGYLVAEKCAGQGIATEALLRLIGDVHGKFKFLIADAHINNIASQKVLEKAGFEKIGIKGDKYYFKKVL